MKKEGTISTTTIIGTEVVNGKGISLGTVRDIICDIHTGEILSVILSFGGFLGIGDQLFAIPLPFFHTTQNGQRLVINLQNSKQNLQQTVDNNILPLLYHNQKVGDVGSYVKIVAHIMEKYKIALD